jgi:DNA oxidative demethylase
MQGLKFLPAHFTASEQAQLVETLRERAREAPFFTPIMPRTGRPFSVRMTNLGPLGWVADRAGYRYQPTHPETGKPWPAMPQIIACLVNYYQEGAKMGLHRDADEEDFAAPVVSISLGDTAIFRIGGNERGGKTETLKLASGDVLIMGGESRLRYHGIDRVLSGTSTLLKDGGRINLTLRRVTRP